MNHKVLLADDSLTIQKVIKITLANQPYDITDASSEEELFKQLPIVKPKIVFLDFNLSDKYTGYELTSKIKSIAPTAEVLLLLGTFDTIDEASLQNSGAADTIVKPFDSNKFIAVCKKLAETYPLDGVPADTSEPIPGPTVDEVYEIHEDDVDAQWTMSIPKEIKLGPEKNPVPVQIRPAPAPVNALAQEMTDWGMSVPNVITGTEVHDKIIDLPPVMNENKSAHKWEQKFPDNTDLDYPEPEIDAATPAPSPKLLDVSNFNSEPLQLEGSYVPEETDVRSIEAQIADEVEEDLWHADEFEELKKEVSSKIDELKNSDLQPSKEVFDESLFRPLDQNEPKHIYSGPIETTHVATSAASINMDEVRSEIEVMVKRHVKEYLDEMFKQNVEKTAWEVIPDLAENLIRQELGKISQKILNDPL
jgi:CheY-like chemotaxis protein